MNACKITLVGIIAATFSLNVYADAPGFMNCTFSNEKELSMELYFGNTKQVNVQKAIYKPKDQGWSNNNEGQMNQSGENNLQFLQTLNGFTLVNVGGGSISAIGVSYKDVATKYLGELAWDAGSDATVTLDISDMVVTYKNSATLKEGTHFQVTTGACVLGKKNLEPVQEIGD